MHHLRIIGLLSMMIVAGFTSKAQERTVSGVVIGADDGLPLPGVTVVVKGTSTGTATGFEGEYAIKINADDAVLVFSFIGMNIQEVEVGNQQVINVTMQDATTDVTEVVVVGYGTQKKVNLSGAVDAIDSEQLESRPISNISQGLQGVMPNLNIDFASGEPGQTPKINIRGMTSINGGDPLIMIDGVPASAEALNRLNPEDVESISVLKDAASAAIYGARAAFGVLLVTTKTGKEDGINISYNNNVSWSKPSILPDKVTDPYIYLRLQELSTDNTPWDNMNYSDETYAWAKERSDNPSASSGVRINPNDPSSWEYMGNRDWTNYFLDDYTISHKHNVAIAGRSENVNYYLSGSYVRENGALKIADDYNERYNFRSKVNFQPYKWLKLGNNTDYTTTNRVNPSYLSVWDLYNIAPTSWDVNPDGSWANSTVGHIAAKLTEGGEEDNKYENFQSTFNGELNFFNNAFRINTDYTFRKGTENYRWHYSKYKIGYGPDDIREVGTNKAFRRATFNYFNAFNIYATFDKTFNKHHLTMLVGFNQEDYRSEWFKAEREGVISSSLPTIALATGEDYVDEYITSWAIRGAFYRLNYIFADRYIVEFNGRYDGSSRFPKDDRFGFFPSASAAWRIDKEGFMSSLGAISALKLRGSYGSLGNQLVSDFGYIPNMTPSLAGYVVEGELPQKVSPPQLVSDNYTWEKVETTNFGVDLGLFDNRIYAGFDIFQRNTLGMLTLGRDLPDVLGASEPMENAADMETKGWELSLSYKDNFKLAGDQFRFNTRFVVSDSRSWITSFDNPNKNLNQYYVGQELGEIWGLHSDGFFTSQEEIDALDQTQIIPWGALSIVPGWPKYVDQDGNNIIEKGLTVDDPKDLKIIGNSTPRYRFSFNVDLQWKGFDVRAFFQGVGRRDFYPEHYLYWGFYQQPYAGGYTHLFDFYRAEADSEIERSKHSQSYIDAGLADANLDAKYPHFQAWLADNREDKGLDIPQTKYMLDGSYLRFKNLTIGYTLPKSLTDKLNIDRLRIYVSGENIAEWSELKQFFDPEAITSSTNGYAYPFQRQYSVGINMNF